MPADPTLWKLALGIGLAALGALALPAATEPSFPAPDQLPASSALPDPLVKLDGHRVTSREEWTARRAELKRLFSHYMYGETPPSPHHVEATVDREDSQALGGKAILREVTLKIGPPDVRPIHLLVVLPSKHRGPVPIFLGLNFCGNHAVLPDPAIRIPDGWMYDKYPGVVGNRATEAGRGGQVEVWNVEQTIDRGYGFATCYNGDIEPDYPNAPEGIRARFAAATPGVKGPHAWGAVAAWAWGLSRTVDYLRTDHAIDSKRIAVVGHSRLGKAAIVAAAFDDRIAMAIPLQAGCGGTAPSRGKIGESVKAVNDHFPHWFDDTFKQFNDQPERLPFDQNCLVALVAPRPVLFSNASEDTWANPEGQFEMLRSADPVYRLLGVGGLDATKMPPLQSLVNSRLGYFIRPGKHSMTREDWSAFLDFADRHLK